MKIQGQLVPPVTTATSAFQQRTVDWVQKKVSALKQEFQSHVTESTKQIKYYIHQYEMDWYLGPFVNSVLTTETPPLLRFTLQTFLAHPQIVYFNKLYEAGTFSKIYEGKLSIYNFIKSECKNLGDIKALTNIFSTLTTGLKFAIIGPLLAYCTAYAFSEMLNGFASTIVTNILKTLLAYMLFQFQNLKHLSIFYALLPTMCIAGSIRGFIFYYASVFFKDLNFDSKNIFYFSMIVRHIFEPQVKKIEKFDFSQFIIGNETISKIVSTMMTGLKLATYTALCAYFTSLLFSELSNTKLHGLKASGYDPLSTNLTYMSPLNFELNLSLSNI